MALGRCLLRLGLALAAIALLACPATASFTESTAGDYRFHERQICYSIGPQMKADPKWVGWINQAVTNWNAVSAQTGWSFRPCAEGELADLSFIFGEGDQDTSAGGSFGGGDQMKSYHSGEGLKPSHFDLKIVRDVSAKSVGGVKPTGGHDGWDTTGAATLDPVLVLMHEMTHAMRLAHDGEAGNTAGKPFDFERAIPVGMHAATPSKGDIEQLHMAAADGKLAPSSPFVLPPCPRDKAATDKAREELRARMAALQKTIEEAGEELVHASGDATIVDLYKRGRQATSDLEDARAKLRELDAPCPSPAKPDANSHGLRPTGASGAAGAAFAAIVGEINRARAAPGTYAMGLDAPAETVAFLQSRSALGPLEWNDALATAAARQAADQGSSGGNSHVGRDGSTVRSRIREAGVLAGIVAEEISLGQSGAPAVVRQLIIDEGNPGHPHRADLFSANLKAAGAACAAHARFRTICVVVMAGAIMPR